MQRLLKYIYGTQDFRLRLRIGNKGIATYAHVDALFAVHSTDCRSHTGLANMLGDALIDTKSSKQRINTNSSSEAELVAVSESMDRIAQTNDFIYHQGYRAMPVPVLYQDNMSTMSLITNAEATRHINVKYFYVKDYIDHDELTVRHMPTADMIADFFTKPLTGAHFIALCKKVVGI